MKRNSKYKENQYTPTLYGYFSELMNWNSEKINTLNSIEEGIRSCSEVDKIGFDEHISTLKDVHLLINQVIGETYIQSQISYVSGRTHSIMASKKLERSRMNIISGMNRSNPHRCESYHTFVENGRNFDSYIKYMQGITASLSSFHQDYIGKWQMYDKLFHDRVRDKLE